MNTKCICWRGICLQHSRITCTFSQVLAMRARPYIRPQINQEKYGFVKTIKRDMSYIHCGDTVWASYWSTKSTKYHYTKEFDEVKIQYWSLDIAPNVSRFFCKILMFFESRRKLAEVVWTCEETRVPRPRLCQMTNTRDGAAWEKKTRVEVDGLCQLRLKIYRGDRIWSRWQNWLEADCVCRSDTTNKEGLYRIQILCRRHPFRPYPAGLTIAAGRVNKSWSIAESIHTTITESIHITPNSMYRASLSGSSQKKTLASIAQSASTVQNFKVCRISTQSHKKHIVHT